jgi:6-phosphogluconate dehydrogenase
MQIGMIGLGKMGGNMAERLRRHGHEVIGFDPVAPSSDVESLAALVEALEAPRLAWSMVPSGEATESTIAALAELMAPGDVVVDGGNSYARDSRRRHTALAERGVHFVDAGVSGGVWGLESGYCVMAGGAAEVIDRLRPVFEALVTDGGFAHVGGPGAGHFAKMVHNGVEYALMQAYAEGYELLGATDIEVDVAATLEVWRHGSVVRSWLLDLLAEAVGEDAALSGVSGWVEDSGEGRWTVDEAVAAAVPVPAIATALFSRFASRQTDAPAMRALATLRDRFGGHGTRPTAPG